MDILDSLEMRWFLPTESPSAATLDRWFNHAAVEGSRVDYYLATARPDLTMKARMASGQATKVETKYLVGSLGLVELAPSVSGDLQRWTKLSVEVDDPELRRDGTWFAVDKKRRLRKYAVTLMPAASATEVALTERPAIGCTVELTELHYTTRGRARFEWTFGLEAFGPPARLLEVFDVVVRTIRSGPALPELAAGWTASYASWLLMQVRICDGVPPSS